MVSGFWLCAFVSLATGFVMAQQCCMSGILGKNIVVKVHLHRLTGDLEVLKRATQRNDLRLFAILVV